MSLDKAIKCGKEKRKEYRGGKSVSHHCCNHGGKRHKNRNPWQCEWCLDNRLHKYKVSELKGKGDYE